MASGSGSDRVPKRDRREAAREKARQMREEAQRRARRRKWIVQGSVSAGVVVVLAIIALVIVTSIRPAGPGPQNMASGGIVLTSTTKAVTTPAKAADSLTGTTKAPGGEDVPRIRVYVDYQCPYCKQFEETNSKQIGQWLDSGKVTLAIHPISILDASSGGTHYSTRAANAAACVANDKPKRFYAVNSALFAKQPPENGNGLTDDEILAILKGAGASSDALTSCVKDGTYSAWIKNVSEKVTSAKHLPGATVPLTGTPTVLVNGTQYPGSVSDAAAFESFVMQAAGSGSGSAPSTPTPTPAN